jgi:hypothetical protein
MTKEKTVKTVPEGLTQVKVNSPYRVVYECEPFVGGDTPTIPTALALEWERNGWVTLAE